MDLLPLTALPLLCDLSLQYGDFKHLHFTPILTATPTLTALAPRGSHTSCTARSLCNMSFKRLALNDNSQILLPTGNSVVDLCTMVTKLELIANVFDINTAYSQFKGLPKARL